MKLLQRIIIDGNPSTVTAQQKGVRVTGGVAHHYTKPKVERAKRELMAQLLPYKPEKPYKGPIGVRIIWRFSRSSWDNKAQKTSFKTTRPDLDNMVKGLADVMTGMFWPDDSDVAEYCITKIWNERGGLLIDIFELDASDYEARVWCFYSRRFDE